MLPGMSGGTSLQGGHSSATAGNVDSAINFGNKFGSSSNDLSSNLMLIAVVIIVLFLFMRKK